MLNWFLDFETSTFTYLYLFIITVIVSVLMLITIKNLSLSALMATQIIFFLCIFLPITIPTIKISKHYKAFNLKREYHSGDFNITFGEAWCIYKDYTGELCKDYVIYVLDEQNRAEQKKREIELEKQQKIDKAMLKKQQKLEKETLRKNKILTNYEKLIEDIKKSEKDN